MQKNTKIVGLWFEEGGGEFFFRPQHLPQFLSDIAEIFWALRDLDLCFEFQGHIPKIGAWGDNRRNKKIRIFWKMDIFQINSQKRVLKLGKFWVSRFVKR